MINETPLLRIHLKLETMLKDRSIQVKNFTMNIN